MIRGKHERIALFALLLMSHCVTPAAAATGRQLAQQARTSPEAVLGYWTPEKLRAAKELTLEPAAAPGEQREAFGISDEPVSVSQPGRRPIRKFPRQKSLLFEVPPRAAALADTAGGAPSRAVGTFGAPFSSSRVFRRIDGVYPYSTVGRLFLVAPGGENLSCSAAVVAPRIVVTAGHCVHDGLGSEGSFYTNFLFVPGFRDGVAPYGVWTVRSVAVTEAWAFGDGRVPNGGDFALLEIVDQDIYGSLRRVGDVVGWLGWQTYSLAFNHLHMVGFSATHDASRRMHQVAATVHRTVEPNSAEYGSDMGEGSSGGPWIQNFGELAEGQADAGLNRIVAVTSYGYASGNPQVQGASAFDRSFVDLMDMVCSRSAGNC